VYLNKKKHYASEPVGYSVVSPDSESDFLHCIDVENSHTLRYFQSRSEL